MENERIFGIEFADAIKTGDMEKAHNTVLEAVQHYSNKITQAINPIAFVDEAFIMYALQTTLNLLYLQNPKAKKLAEQLSRGLTCESVTLPMPNKNRPD